MDSRFRGNDGGFSCFRGELRGIFCGEFRRFFRNSAPPPSDSRRQIPASPLSFPRTRESIFADKFPISRRCFLEFRRPDAVRFCRQIPASPPSFPRTRESIFADKFPSFTPLWKNEVNSQFCSSKWIPAFAGMTGVFLVFGGNCGGFFAANSAVRRRPIPSPFFLRIRAECVILSQTFLSERKSNEKHNQ